jgi:hypothetical protein
LYLKAVCGFGGGGSCIGISDGRMDINLHAPPFMEALRKKTLEAGALHHTNGYWMLNIGWE